LAYHYAQLQALAFEEDFDTSDPDTIADLDKTFPKHGGMHKIAGKCMEAWNNAIRDDPRAIETLKGGTKRTVHKVEVDEADLVDIEGAWRNGNMSGVSRP
jgi:ATP-dependent DNA helicase 2 subunit 1